MCFLAAAWKQRSPNGSYTPCSLQAGARIRGSLPNPAYSSKTLSSIASRSCRCLHSATYRLETVMNAPWSWKHSSKIWLTQSFFACWTHAEDASVTFAWYRLAVQVLPQPAENGPKLPFPVCVLSRDSPWAVPLRLNQRAHPAAASPLGHA